MATQDKRNFASRLDRRVELLKPVTVTDAYNEQHTEYQSAYSNFPAHRKDNVTSENESLDDRLLQASSVVEWEIRFIPNLGIKSTWRIRDMHDGKLYSIIAPPLEIGRREGIRVKSMIVE